MHNNDLDSPKRQSSMTSLEGSGLFGNPFNRAAHFESSYDHERPEMTNNFFRSSASKGMPENQDDDFMTQIEDPANYDNFLKGTEYDIFGQADRQNIHAQLFGGLEHHNFVPHEQSHGPCQST